MAEKGYAIKIIGMLIQKDAFSSKGKLGFLEFKGFLLKNSTKPPGNIYSSN
jgi:hypothetical protein